MTSGKRTSAETIYAIQRLASYKASDGSWLLSYEQIAHRLRIDSRVVATYVREGCRCWHHLSRWQAPPGGS
jgi:hypothetical protein